MNRKQFYEFSDVWYQRTHNLRRVWQNPSESEKRRLKAFLLWHIMKDRVMNLFEIAKQFETIPEYRKGATDKPEIVLDK